MILFSLDKTFKSPKILKTDSTIILRVEGILKLICSEEGELKAVIGRQQKK